MKKFRTKGIALLLSFLMAVSCFSGYLPDVKAGSVSTGHVVIQEVYGGGGNSGAKYKNDYIVLYNPTSSSVSLEGWSVQYASAAGKFSTNTTILSGSIGAGKYYLIQEAKGGGGTDDLPTPDATGSIAMGASNLKVALVNSSTAISGKSDPSVVDFIGAGTANEAEGIVAPAPSATTSIARAKVGVDTDDNSVDFVSGAPDPKNSTASSGTTDNTQVSEVSISPKAGAVVSGQQLTLSCDTQDATIFYQINNRQASTYDGNAKPSLNDFPATVVIWAEKSGMKASDKVTYQYSQSVTDVVTATPGSGQLTTGTKVQLSCTTPGAAIKYSLDKGSTWVTYSGDGILVTTLPYTIQAKAVANGYSESSVSEFNYTSADAQQHTGEYNVYFGQLHSHTTLSDGAGTVEQAFDYASKVANLDFLAVTDHSNSFEGSTYTSTLTKSAMDNASWKEGKTAAAAITAKGLKNTDNKMDSNSSFLGIYGFEMTWSDGSGHINTFNTPGFENRNNPIFANKTQSSANPSGLDTYYKKLAQVSDSISQFNHPGTTFGDFYDFTDYSAQNDNSMDLIEVGNGEGAIGSNGYFPSYGYYTRALDKGWHLAPTNNQDNHKGKWGDANTARSVILADSLTEDSLYDALKNRRVYATEDNDLSINYKLNGNIMGSILTDHPKTVDIEAKLDDPTDSAIGKVEVIVNGGKVAASKTVNTNSQQVSFQLNNDYTYYYLRVTQSDGDIAVTAPVWTGDVEKAGIASVTADTQLPVSGENFNITTNLYNNEASDLTVESIEYNDGTTFKTVQGNDLDGGATLSALSTKALTFAYTPVKKGDNSIQVTMKAKINNVEKVYTSVLNFNVADATVVSKVLIDGTHLNDYVDGYYSGNMTNFIDICAKEGVQARIETNTITSQMLDNTDLLVITAPLKADKTGKLKPSEFEPDFMKMVSDYVNGGGKVIVCGTADYQDSSSGDPYTTTTQINHLLKAMGAKTTINSDEDYDTTTNGGQPYRLKLSKVNTSSDWTKGIDPAQGYSVYSGCSVNLDKDSDWLVKGESTTYSINSKKISNNEYESPVDLNAKVISDGNVCVLSTEQVGKGTIFVGGSIFLSNFEVKAVLDNYSDLQYSNYNIVSNILDAAKKDISLTSIADVRNNGKDGDVFRIEGTVTAGSEGSNAFFDTIYVEDATGGIDVFPIANGSGIQVGQKVRVIGHVDSYQGDKELKIGSGVEGLTVLDSTIHETQPQQLSAAQAMNYDTNGGKLVKVKGTVSDINVVNGELSSFSINDGSGKAARIFVDGYVAKGFSYGDILKNGNVVSVAGLVYNNPDGVCLRVRNCNEIVLTSAASDSGNTGNTRNNGGTGTNTSDTGNSGTNTGNTTDNATGSSTVNQQVNNASQSNQSVLVDASANTMKTDGAKNSNSPATGDHSSMEIYLLLAVMTGLLAVATIILRRKTEREGNNE